MYNLLNAIPEGGKDAELGETAVYALIGFLVVFAGIALLIFIVWLVGKIMARFGAKRGTETVPVKQTVEEPITSFTPQASEEISEETVAVIMAALMAYYQKNNPKCEFTVKRIKRI